MSEPADDVKTSRPWQWPGEWVRDEKFWRDVASRTASGLLVVVIAYVWAVMAGYLTSPDFKQNGRELFTTLLFYAGLVGTLLAYPALIFAKDPEDVWAWGWLTRIFAVGMMLAVPMSMANNWIDAR